MIYARGTVKRVYKEVQGGVLAQALTSSWTNGSSLLIEACTDFSPDGGDAVFEPGTASEEAFSYSGCVVNPSDALSARDSLTGVIRSNPVAHANGTAIQEGASETVTKMVDVEVDGELFTGIPVDASIYAYLKLGTYADEEMPVVGLEFDENGLGLVVTAPLGAVPSFDEDGEVLPPIDEMPPPVPGGKKPEAPTGFNLTARNVALPDGTFVYFVDAVYMHSGLYDDGSDVTGLHFRADFFDGATKRFVIEAGSALSFTQQVEGNKTYDVNLYALDFANTESDAATDNVTTSPDSSAPATPTGLALLGGAGGGGVGIIYAQWTANTETDFDHYEVHASTSSGFTPSNSTLVAVTAATNHPISKAFNGTSITTFGYTTTIYVKLKSVDRSGNKSAASSQVSSTAQQAASADITDIQSDNYVLGTSGWRFTKAGNLEANSGTFRGSLTAGTIVSLSSSGGGITITGSTDSIHLGTSGSGLTLSGSGTGSISFGSGCTISGASAGAINVGTGITLSGTDAGGGSAGKVTVGSGITIDGAGTGTITGGTFRTASSGTYVRMGANASGNDVIELWNGTTVLGRIASSTTGVGSLNLRGAATVYIDTPFASGTVINVGAGNAETVNLNPWGDVNLGEVSASTNNVFVNAPMTTISGVGIHIGGDTNSTGNVLSFRNTAGTPSAPAAGRAVIFYDASAGANGVLKARNPTSTQTLATF